MNHKFSHETRTLVYPAGVVKPEDLLTFIHFNHFTTEWRRLGLSDDDLRALEVAIMASPKASPVMRETGRLRKLRFAPRRWNAGKSGALRIGFAFIEEISVVGLIVVFSKKQRANLSKAERSVVKKLISEFRKMLLE